jgi:hypothetical protein
MTVGLFRGVYTVPLPGEAFQASHAPKSFAHIEGLDSLSVGTIDPTAVESGVSIDLEVDKAPRHAVAPRVVVLLADMDLSNVPGEIGAASEVGK